MPTPLLLIVIGFAATIGIILTLLLLRRRRIMPGIAIFFGSVIGCVWASFIFTKFPQKYIVLMGFGALAAGAICLKLVTSQKGNDTKTASLLSGFFGSFTFPLVFITEVGGPALEKVPSLHEYGEWLPYFAAAMLLSILFITLLSYALRRYAASLLKHASTPLDRLEAFMRTAMVSTDTSGTAPSANKQDREMVLNMLREGKVSGEQATELLTALGPTVRNADKLPLTIPVIGAVSGAILIVIGFMLPWSHLQIQTHIFGTMKSYQTGYNVGALGWIILIAGILPAIFACIPSLDKHLRQGLLRIVIAILGSAFVVVLLTRSPQGIGLWVVAMGFGLQLLTAFWQVSFLAGTDG